MSRPTDLKKVWSEKDLCAHLGLPTVGVHGKRSRQLSTWIRGGLNYIEISGKRYFNEKDVIDFLWNKKSQR